MARKEDPASLEAGENLKLGSKTGDTFIEQRSADDFLQDEEIDAVFGAANGDGPKYRSLGWKGAVILMLKTQIGIGVLALPFTLTVLGALPGAIVLALLGVLTTWSGYVIGQFKLKHRSVFTFGDVGHILWGPIGREALGAIYLVFFIAISAAGLLGTQIALNTVSERGTCALVFIIVPAVVVFIFASIQTLNKISILGWIGLVSVGAAVLTLTVAVGIQDRPSAAPQTGPWEKMLEVIPTSTTFAQAAVAVSNVLFSLAGPPAYLNVIAEMKVQEDYTKALLWAQGLILVFYFVIAFVVYGFTGQYVSSPALGSAGVLLAKVCYGLAIPALVVSAIIYIHLSAKYLFVRLMRSSEHLTKNSKTHYLVWFSCVGGCSIAAFVLAAGIPVFDSLIGLIGASIGAFLVLIIEAWMWFHMNWAGVKSDRSFKLRGLIALNVFMVITGLFILGSGTYGSVLGIMDALSSGSTTQPFSCT